MKAQDTMTTVLITGATSGIGRATALYLAERGYRVFATGRRQEALEALNQQAAGLALEALRLDVTDASSIEEARAHVEARTNGHGIDVLINNAGWGLAAPLSEVADDALRRQYDTNVFGLMAVTRAFLPEMRERGRGRVLNVTSVGGRITFPLFGAYTSSKYAVESMSDALRNELRPFGIDVVLIEPGIINTGFSDRSRHEIGTYADNGSSYQSVLERADMIQAQSDKMGVGPEVIARAMHRAIRARRPRARYVAPFRYHFMLAFFRFLPTRLTDWLLRQTIGLTPKRLLGRESEAVEVVAAG